MAVWVVGSAAEASSTIWLVEAWTTRVTVPSWLALRLAFSQAAAFWSSTVWVVPEGRWARARAVESSASCRFCRFCMARDMSRPTPAANITGTMAMAKMVATEPSRVRKSRPSPRRNR